MKKYAYLQHYQARYEANLKKIDSTVFISLNPEDMTFTLHIPQGMIDSDEWDTIYATLNVADIVRETARDDSFLQNYHVYL